MRAREALNQSRAARRLGVNDAWQVAIAELLGVRLHYGRRDDWAKLARF